MLFSFSLFIITCLSDLSFRTILLFLIFLNFFFLRKDFQTYFLVAEKQLSRRVVGKDVLKICSKFTGGHPCRSTIAIRLLNHTLACVFSCKFSAYFYNTYSQEYLWTTAWKLTSPYDFTCQGESLANASTSYQIL